MYKFRGLCLHSTSVILPNHSNDLLTFKIKVPVKIFDPTLKCIDFKKKTDANSFQSRSEARSATVTVRVSNLRDFLAMFSPVDR